MATEGKDSPCDESHIFDCESLSDPDDASYDGENEEEELARRGLDSGSLPDGDEHDTDIDSCTDTYTDTDTDANDEEDDDSEYEDRTPYSFDRLQSSWSNASWSLQGSMDTDHFFLVPSAGVTSPPNPGSLSRSRSSPSTSVRSAVVIGTQRW